MKAIRIHEFGDPEVLSSSQSRGPDPWSGSGRGAHARGRRQSG